MLAQTKIVELASKPWLPRPKLVCVAGRIVAEAQVIVSPRDPNWFKGPRAGRTNGVVQVRIGWELGYDYP